MSGPTRRAFPRDVLCDGYGYDGYGEGGCGTRWLVERADLTPVTIWPYANAPIASFTCPACGVRSGLTAPMLAGLDWREEQAA